MFIKILKNFIKLLLLTFIAVWLSENYGKVDIIWLGYKIETSLPVFIFLTYLFIIISKILLKLLFAIPKLFKKKKKIS